MRKTYYTEMSKLAQGLVDRDIAFTLKSAYDGFQIIVERGGSQVWDAICHKGSYGGERGLLEIMGELVDVAAEGDTVVGFLTGEDVLKRIDDLAETRTLIKEGIEYLSDATGIDFNDLADDFGKFQKECDRLMIEEGLTEKEALDKLYKTWKFDFTK